MALKPFAACKDILSLRALRLFASAAFIGIALSGCSFGGPETGGNAPPPVPAGSAQAQVQQPSTMDTFRALAPPEGLKFTPLFAEQIGDEDLRFRRVEDVVQTMKNDFDTVMPAITRLVAVEKDIKDLVSQLETLTNGGTVESEPLGIEEKLNRIPREDTAGGTDNVAGTIPAASSVNDTSRVTPEAASTGQLPPEGAASPSLSAPVNIKPAAPAPTPAPVLAPAATAPVLGDVKSIRIGDHMDKTRIVLDMSAKANFSASLQNGGKQLVIDLPQMSYSAQKNWEAMTAMLVSGYHYENGKLYLDLLYPSEIKTQNILSPNGNSNHRLVIDLFAKGVHQ